MRSISRLSNNFPILPINVLRHITSLALDFRCISGLPNHLPILSVHILRYITALTVDFRAVSGLSNDFPILTVDRLRHISTWSSGSAGSCEDLPERFYQLVGDESRALLER